MKQQAQDITEVEISIAGRTLSINCPANEINALKNAADEVEKMILLIVKTNANANVERAAILTALNFGHKLLQPNQSNNHTATSTENLILKLHETLKNAVITETDQASS